MYTVFCASLQIADLYLQALNKCWDENLVAQEERDAATKSKEVSFERYSLLLFWPTSSM